MEPHAELFCHLIIYDFWTFKDTATFNVVAFLVAHAQCHSAVAPVYEIFRCIAHYAHHGTRGGVGLMLAKPIIGLTVLHDASPVGIDVPAAVVEPQFTALDSHLFRLDGLTCSQYSKQCSYEYGFLHFYK